MVCVMEIIDSVAEIVARRIVETFERNIDGIMEVMSAEDIFSADGFLRAFVTASIIEDAFAMVIAGVSEADALRAAIDNHQAKIRAPMMLAFVELVKILAERRRNVFN